MTAHVRTVEDSITRRGNRTPQPLGQLYSRTAADAVARADAAVWPPVLRAGPTVDQITNSGFRVTWTVMPASQGQVEYGLTSAYGSATTPELSFSYTTHIQEVTGLAAGTLYHYRIKATNPTGQITYSTDQTTTTLGAIVYPATINPVTYVAMNSDTMPGWPLGTITDSSFTDITHRRITNVDLRRNRYPTDQPWNSDSSRLYLPYDRRMLNGQSYADIGAVSGSFDHWLWSNTDPDVAYTLQYTTGVFGRYNVSTGVITTIRDFTVTHADQPNAYVTGGGGYALDSGYTGNLSLDSHLTGFYCRRADSTYDIIAYDPIDDRIEAIRNQSLVPSSAWVAYSGTYIGVDDTSGVNSYSMTARSGTTPGAFTSPRTVGVYSVHCMPGQNAANEDVLIIAGGYGKVVRLSDGVESGALVAINRTLSGGYGGYAMGRPGWVYWSSEYRESGWTNDPGFGQVVAVKMDGSGDAQSFGLHHNAATSSSQLNGAAYDRRPFGTPNRLGNVVIYGSDWHGEGAPPPSGPTYCFVCGVGA